MDLSASKVFDLLTENTALPPCEIFGFSPDRRNDLKLKQLFWQPSGQLHPALALCDDFLICIGTGSAVYEILILRTSSVYDNPQVEEMLTARADLLQNNPFLEQEDSNGTLLPVNVFSVKNFVFLLATEDNDGLYQRIVSLLH